MKLLLFLEKYGTSKDDNKITYVMVPADHSLYAFPYNLEDRVKNTISKIKHMINRDFDYTVKKDKKGSYEGITNLPNYLIEVKSNKYLEVKNMEKMGFELIKNTYILNIQ
jgi:hypothetical protein